MSTGKEINERIEAMSADHRKMLADAVDVLSQCFGNYNGSALLVFVPPEVDVAQVFVLNANELDALKMCAFAADHLTALITKGMPEKGMLN